LLIKEEIEAIDETVPKEILNKYATWDYYIDGGPYRSPFNDSSLEPYEKPLRKRDALRGDISLYERYWWSESGAWLKMGRNNYWYWTWCLGPIGVGLITVVGIRWIIRGFKPSGMVDQR
jgi:hypothetical protein